MTRLVAGLSVFALALFVANSASAQPGRGGPGGFNRGMGGGGIGMLLMNEGVRGEVAIEADQLKELEALRDEMRDQMRERFEGMQDLSPEERRDAFQNMRSEMEDLRSEAESRLEGVLTPGQIQRLRQIELQQQVERGGSRALLNGPIADKLGITPEQQEEMRKKAQAEEAKLREQIQKLTLESRERVLAVLTEEQRAQFKELVGEKFDMPQPQFQGRGGQRGQRPGRRPRPELE